MDKQPSSPEHRKSEVTIIAGFLGAGKTTLLKKILSWESDLSETVVIVNEFGDVGIDGSVEKCRIRCGGADRWLYLLHHENRSQPDTQRNPAGV